MVDKEPPDKIVLTVTKSEMAFLISVLLVLAKAMEKDEPKDSVCELFKHTGQKLLKTRNEEPEAAAYEINLRPSDVAAILVATDFSEKPDMTEIKLKKEGVQTIKSAREKVYVAVRSQVGTEVADQLMLQDDD